MSEARQRIAMYPSLIADLPDDAPPGLDYDRVGELVGLLVKDAYRELRQSANEQTRRQRTRRRALPRAA